jgi:large subunit ribosomal protein L17
MNSKSNLNKFGVKKSHRDSLIKTILSDLVIYEHVTTSKAKAKAIAPLFDKAVVIAKMDMSRREVERKLGIYVGNDLAVSKMIDVIGKRFTKEKSGLVKLYPLQRRKGDGAEQITMIVKGYTYKEVGKKVSGSSTSKKEATKPESKSKAPTIAAIDSKGGKSQVAGSVNKSTVKSRSGI